MAKTFGWWFGLTTENNAEQESAGDTRGEQSGAWLGSMTGLTVRDPGPDADGPVLEIHGDGGFAAVEIDNDAYVDGLSHAAAEVQMSYDNMEVEE